VRGVDGADHDERAHGSGAAVVTAAPRPAGPAPIRGVQRLRAKLGATPGRLQATVAGLCLVLLVTQLFYAFVLPQTPSRMAKRSAELVGELGLWSWTTSLPLPVPHAKGLIAGVVILLAVVAFAAYGLIVWLLWGRTDRRAGLVVVSFVGASFLVSALALPNLNSDVYDYILFGRVVAEHDSNPADTFPEDFPDDPVYAYSSHQYTGERDNKLPAWTVVSVGLAHLGGDDPVSNLLLFRFTLLAINLGSVALVWTVLRRLHPAAALAGVALYGLNPIVSVQGQSKTDTLMAFLLLAAVALLVARHRRSAVVALGLSMFVKLITVPLALVFWVRELRLRRWPQLVGDGLTVGIIALALYAPFSEHGLDLLFDHMGLLGSGGSSAPEVLRPVIVAAFGLFILAVGLRQDGSHEQLLRGWALTALVFGLFLSRPGLAWYLVVAIAAVAVAAEWRMAVAVVVMSFSSFLVSTWSMTDSASHPLPDLLDVPRLVLYAAPVLAAAIVLLLWRRWRARLGLPPGEAPSPYLGQEERPEPRSREPSLSASRTG
jgi:hypothetical protein